MKKTGSTGFFILFVLFFLISLLWFFWIKNTAVGIIWLCAAVCELIIALITLKKERTGKKSPSKGGED